MIAPQSSKDKDMETTSSRPVRVFFARLELASFTLAFLSVQAQESIHTIAPALDSTARPSQCARNKRSCYHLLIHVGTVSKN